MSFDAEPYPEVVIPGDLISQAIDVLVQVRPRHSTISPLDFRLLIHRLANYLAAAKERSGWGLGNNKPIGDGSSLENCRAQAL